MPMTDAHTLGSKEVFALREQISTLRVFIGQLEGVVAPPPHLVIQNRALRDENDTLRERIRQLEELLIAPAPLPRHWKFPFKEEKLLCAIRASSPIYFSISRAMCLLYGMEDNPPDETVIQVMICLIRRKLRKIDGSITLENRKAHGWRMSPESCAAFDAAVAADQARWPMLVRAA